MTMKKRLMPVLRKMAKTKKSICRKIGNSIYSVGRILPTRELGLIKIPKKQSKRVCKKIVK